MHLINHQFSEYQPETLTKTIQNDIQNIKNYYNKILVESMPTWDNTIQLLQNVSDDFSQNWGLMSHYHSVLDTEEWRNAYNQLLPEISQLFSFLSQSLPLFELYNNVEKQQKQESRQQKEQFVEITKSLQDFVLSGVNLPDEKKQELEKIHERLSQLSAKFSENVQDDTDEFSMIEKNYPEGMPELLKSLYEQEDRTFKFGLNLSLYLPVMQNAKSREFREKLYKAYVTRASGESEKSENRNNLPLIIEILNLRQQEATILGFENHATLSLATKMAENPQQIFDFLYELANKAKPFAQKELQQLNDLALEVDLLNENLNEKFNEQAEKQLQPWDLPYLSNLQLQREHNISDDLIRQYFPYNQVKQGLFQLIEKLFQIKMVEATNQSTWHEDVKAFDLLDLNNNSAIIGRVYIDPFMRSGKKSGAWMSDFASRGMKNNQLQLPIAVLVMNFMPQTAECPSLLTFDEVTTFFHEFGHGLHHLLTEISCLGISGISRVEWDAVELPSQFLENFAWQPEVIEMISKHYQTNEKLPQDLLQKLLNSKNFQMGLQTLRQVEFSINDLKLHCINFNNVENNKADTSENIINDILLQTKNEINITPSYEGAKPLNTFSHIFAGGYSAGYYSYKWAEVLSCDCFSRFEEEGIFNPVVGNSFRKEILAVGSSRPAMTSFKEFRGRSPEPLALLKQCGLV